MKLNLKMKSLALVGMLVGTFSLTGNSQVAVDVTASGGSFTTADVIINVGDTVRWTNTGGTHNVNGTTATFSTNPASFGNAVGTGWTYFFVFTVAGSYDYRCDVHFGSGMVGTVTVNGTSGIEELSTQADESSVNVYAVPTSEEVVINFSNELIDAKTSLIAVVYDLSGKEIYRSENITDTKFAIDTKEWTGSMYIVHVLSDSQIIEKSKVVIR